MRVLSVILSLLRCVRECVCVCMCVCVYVYVCVCMCAYKYVLVAKDVRDVTFERDSLAVEVCERGGVRVYVCV